MPLGWPRTALIGAGLLLLIAAAGAAFILTWPAPGAPAAGPTRPGSPSPAPTTSATTTPVPRPTTTNTPLATRDCAPHPSRCGFPDATNTGVPGGTRLRPVNGDMKVTQAGMVIDGVSLNGCITIEAPQVTIRDSKVSCPGPYGIFSYEKNYSGGGLLIEDVEVDCEDTQATGIASYGFTALRVKVHGCENGFSIDNTSIVRDSYVYDLFIGNGGHTDGIQMGGNDDTIVHNTILNAFDGGTSAIITPPTGMSHVDISGNLLAGGAYTLYCPRTSSTAVVVTNNRFSRIYSPHGGEYGPWVYCDMVAEQHGNVWDDNSTPLPL
jgi:hypothetical protein